MWPENSIGGGGRPERPLADRGGRRGGVPPLGAQEREITEEEKTKGHWFMEGKRRVRKRGGRVGKRDLKKGKLWS